LLFAGAAKGLARKSTGKDIVFWNQIEKLVYVSFVNGFAESTPVNEAGASVDVVCPNCLKTNRIGS